MTHAMVISAVHLDGKLFTQLLNTSFMFFQANGNPVRFKVENSWGPDVGDKGYFVMTSAWFDEYVMLAPRVFFLWVDRTL
jgi:bleomycin hydrolase